MQPESSSVSSVVWDQLDREIQEFESSHTKLRQWETRLEGLNKLQMENAADPRKSRQILDDMQSLFDEREVLSSELAGRSQGLARRIDELGHETATSVTRPIEALLDDLRILANDAVVNKDPELPTKIREATRRVRLELHDLRRAQLSGHIQNIEEVVAELVELEEDVAEIQTILHEAPFLDLALEVADRYLTDEYNSQRTRVDQKRRALLQERSQLAQRELRAILQTEPTELKLEQLLKLIDLIDRASESESAKFSAHRAAQQALGCVARSSIEPSDRLELWLELAARAWTGQHGFERIASLAEFLPTSIQDRALITRTLGELRLLSDRSGEGVEEYWPSIERFSAQDRVWARCLFHVLHTDEPEPRAVARLLALTGGAEPVNLGEVLPKILAGLPRHHRYPVEHFLHSHLGERVSVDERPLLERWLLRQDPCPSVEALKAWGYHAGYDGQPVFWVLVAALAISTRAEGELPPDIRERMSSVQLDHWARALATILEHGRDKFELAIEHPDVVEHLDHVLSEQGIIGKPARGFYLKAFNKELGDLRHRAREDEECLATVRAINPDKEYQRAAKQHKLKSLNPGAVRTIKDKLSTFSLLVPIEVELVGVAPLPGRDDLKRSCELERERVEDGILRQALATWGGPALTPSDEDLVGSDARYSAIAEVQDWVAVDEDLILCAAYAHTGELLDLGRECLERWAGVRTAEVAVDEYVERLDHTRARVAAQRAAAGQRQQMLETIAAREKQARDETRAMIESFLVSPIQLKLETWPVSETPEITEPLREILDCAIALLAKVDDVSITASETECMELDELSKEYMTRAEELISRCQRDVRGQLIEALDHRPGARTHRDAPFLARAYGHLLRRDLRAATEALRIAELPPGSAERELAVDQRDYPELIQEELEFVAEPVVPVKLSELRVATRAEFDHANQPIEVGESPFQLSSDDFTDKQNQLLQTAATLYRSKSDDWRLWLSQWSLNEGHAAIRRGDITTTIELSKDVVALVAGAPEYGNYDWTRDEALRLWLAATLVSVKASNEGLEIDWDALRGDSAYPLSELIYRFFVSRRAQALASIVIDCVRIGGVAPGLLLSNARSRGQHMHDLLLREVARNTSKTNALRAAAITFFLKRFVNPLRAPELTSKIEIILRNRLEEWSRPEPRKAFTDYLSVQSVPETYVTIVCEAFDYLLATARHGPQTGPEFSMELRTNTIYVSAFDIEEKIPELLVEVSYNHHGPDRDDLRVVAEVQHPAFAVPESIAVVPTLSRKSSVELSFPLRFDEESLDVDRREETFELQITLRLFSQGEGGRIGNMILQRKPKVIGSWEYPYEDRQTPYVLGPAITEPGLFVGRSEDVNQILSWLIGKKHSNFVMIHGPRRIGKSSLLYRLTQEPKVRQRYVPIHIDLEGELTSNDTNCSLLQRWANKIDEQLSNRVTREAPPLSPISTTEPTSDFKNYLQRVSKVLPGEKRLLILFDEFQMLFAKIAEARASTSYGRPDTALHADIIKAFRHWVQHLPIAVIVAGTNELKDEVSEKAQRLYGLGQIHRLPRLAEDATRKLIVGIDEIVDMYEVTPQAVKMVLDETRGEPLLAQQVCQGIFDFAKVNQTGVVSLSDVEAICDHIARADNFLASRLTAKNQPVERRTVIAALAEIVQHDRRSNVQDVVERLRVKGVGAHIASDTVVASVLEWLRKQDLAIYWRREKTYRLDPPMLYRHVLQREEYEI